MSILAGIISRKKEITITEEIRRQLCKEISRDPSDSVSEAGNKYAYLVKVDFGAFGAPAVKIDNTGSISMIAGEPLLTTGSNDYHRTRFDDLEILHDLWLHEDWKLLDTARGTFCAVHYNPADDMLYLIADKLGVRALYYYIGTEYIVYATALRIFENLQLVPKIMDMAGVTETVCFGAPLSDRTTYSDIKMMSPSEIIRITPTTVHKDRYWRLDNITVAGSSYEESIAKVNKEFEEAVKRRLRNDHAVLAFLSGGLDSRSIVAMVRKHGVNVNTLNYAPENTQDRFFAAQIARTLGTRHQDVQNDGVTDVRRKSSDIWSNMEYPDGMRPDRYHLAWAGDGGSVGMGHVYLDKELDEMMSGRMADAISRFLKNRSVVKRLYNKKIVDELSKIPARGIESELGGSHCQEPGRSFYLFLMFNDQRRHLSYHFESMDLHKMEFQLPFFDSQLLEAICSVPIKRCLYHGLYMDWLNRFLPVCVSVPWQAYPGHIPCPLHIPQDLRYQFGGGYHSRDAKKNVKLQITGEAVRMLKSTGFPDNIVRKNVVRLALISTYIGIKNYDYIISAASTYYKYWIICDGKVASWRGVAT